MAEGAVREIPGDGGSLTLELRGRLDSTTTGAVWREAFAALERRAPKRLVVDAAGVEYCDGAGVALLVQMRCHQEAAGGTADVQNLAPDFERLLELFPAECFTKLPEPRKEVSRIALVGEVTIRIIKDVGNQVAFVGELATHAAGALFRPRTFRWRDTLVVAETAGVNALPIMALMGFLIGLILSFQSAVALKPFGAEMFVADLVAISMVRELGPLLTAILMAGRSGSAFAAELGTMKVNEEIDAITTMGLAPVRFLALPRVLAGTMVMPMLTIFTILASLVGASVVYLSIGFPLVTFVNQVSAAVGVVDFVGGLAKAVVFGLLVAAVGCLRGLQTRSGAIAVGDSTTRSVVSGILLIILSDGIFSVIFYVLEI